MDDQYPVYTIQQTSSTCILNTFSVRLLDCVNGVQTHDNVQHLE